MPKYALACWRVALLSCVVPLLGGCGAPDGSTAEANTDSVQSAVTLDPNGESASVYSYANAIRERVFIPAQGIDQNGDAVTDRTALDIIRPVETNSGLKVPVIIVASPYFTSTGDGHETEYLHSTASGASDKMPLFYDNFFVPRGYAVAALQPIGTGWSTGCALHGGPGDIAAIKSVINWLQGAVPGYYSVTNVTPAAVASWHNGKAALIGKSYDGTLAVGAAATGVTGLTTVVPLSAIFDWYDYSRSNGVGTSTVAYPAALTGLIQNNASATALGVVPPSNLAACAAQRAAMTTASADDTNDVNAFWTARAYSTTNWHASVFASHGINDDNVRPDHLSKLWAGLAAANVPRKLWLSQEGHVDPFDYRRGAWVDELHRWFDYWLLGVQNGIMSEPRVDIETAKNTWVTQADWPSPAAANVDVFLQGVQAGTAGQLALSSGGALSTLTFTDIKTQSETTMMNGPTGNQDARLVFLSPTLTTALHFSGTPKLDIHAALSTTQSNLGALLVDYGTGTHSQRSTEGIQNAATSSCWGDTLGIDDGCYIDVNELTVDAPYFRITKGILDSSNRDSLTTATLATIGTSYRFQWPLITTEYVVPAGHQLGVVLVGNYSSYSSTPGTVGSVITVDTKLSKVVLPVVGGSAAVVAAFTPPPPMEDAGTGGGANSDAGLPTNDAAPPEPDSGTSTDDAGQVDAGTPLEDAGTPLEDAGTPTPDAGARPEDAGTPSAAGGSSADAGEGGALADAGSANATSGASAGGASAANPTAGDAGKPDIAQPSASSASADGGCSCDVARSKPSPTLGFLAASLLFAAQLRRGKRRQQPARRDR